MAKLTEDHQLLLEKHRSGTKYRRILAELRHRGIDAERQVQMWDEIADVLNRCVEPSESTIKQLLNNR